MEYPSALPGGKRAIPFPRPRQGRVPGFLACGLVIVLFACTGGAGGGEAGRLPTFGPADAALFDDRLVLEPGLENSYRADPRAKLQERVRRADAVLRVRVATVTRASANLGMLYSVVVRPLAPPLAGELPDAPLTLTVTSADPGFSTVRQLETRLVSKTLVLFLKRYNGGPRQGTLRWHAEPDSPELNTLVRRAASPPGTE